jgi:divalent metal cation (Fe/Co/Zn/Cd) transporter
MVINILLAGLKLALGIFGVSQALVADAVHSLSEMSTDIAVLFGVKFWSASVKGNQG